MAKQKKKRNKQYKGSGAAQTQPIVTHVAAVKRNKAQLWWLDHKRIVKPLVIGGGIATAVVILVIELFRLFL
jgi:hypothetical protein